MPTTLTIPLLSPLGCSCFACATMPSTCPRGAAPLAADALRSAADAAPRRHKNLSFGVRIPLALHLMHTRSHKTLIRSVALAVARQLKAGTPTTLPNSHSIFPFSTHFFLPTRYNPSYFSNTMAIITPSIATVSSLFLVCNFLVS